MSGELFESLYNRAANGQLSTSLGDNVLDVNDTFLSWTGYSREQVVGRGFHEFLTSGSQLLYQTRYQSTLLMNREVREVGLMLSRADGTFLPIVVNAVITTVLGETQERVLISVFDATERQNWEADLLAARRLAESSEARIRVLRDATVAFIESTTEAELADALGRTARDAFAAADAAVIFYDSDGAIRVAYGDHLIETLTRLRHARGASGRPLGREFAVLENLDDAEKVSPDAAAAMRAVRAEALTAVPIVGAAGVLGALVCFFGRTRHFESDELDAHKALARQAATVLERQRLQHELQFLAMHDQLTGLANRNLLRERLSHTLASAERSGRAMSLIFLDLDGFKRINDDLGHRVGDGVLQTVATRINDVVREADIVGRFGGDEFLIVCEDATADAAGLIAARVVDAVRQPIDDLDLGYSVTASVGIASYSPGAASAPTNDSLVRLADAAMYQSKNAGPGRVTVKFVED